MVQWNFEGIGTKWQIDIYQDLTKEKESEVLASVRGRVEVYDKTYSRFRADSLVTKMSKEIGVFTLPEDAKKMLSLYYNLYKITDGFFTPFVGNILSDAGYDANYSLIQKNKLKIPPKWEEAIFYEHPKIQIIKPTMLDFGAGGKGYLVDLVAEVLETNNIYNYCIDAGGDILHKGSTPIRVGLENPDNVNQVIGVYSLQNESICGSAGNRRAWGDFTHIMNPKTLSSQKDILAVWVVAKEALLADALTTCLSFVPAKILAENYQFEYLLIKNNHSIEKSKNFSAEIFTAYK